MTFGEPTLNPPDTELCLVRWTSQPAGLWRLELNRVIFGIRCTLSHKSDEMPDGTWAFYHVTYCCGLNRLAMILLPGVVRKILEPLDERVMPGDVKLPEQRVKPMHNDPDCWLALCELAGVASRAEDLIDLSQGNEIPLAPLI
jgi:hypothetical protein